MYGPGATARFLLRTLDSASVSKITIYGSPACCICRNNANTEFGAAYIVILLESSRGAKVILEMLRQARTYFDQIATVQYKPIAIKISFIQPHGVFQIKYVRDKSTVLKLNDTALAAAHAVALLQRQLPSWCLRVTIITYARPKLIRPQSRILIRKTIFRFNNTRTGSKEQIRSENIEYPTVFQ